MNSKQRQTTLDLVVRFAVVHFAVSSFCALHEVWLGRVLMVPFGLLGGKLFLSLERSLPTSRIIALLLTILLVGSVVLNSLLWAYLLALLRGRVWRGRKIKS